MQSATEVTHVVLFVALAAQRSHLTGSPLFTRITRHSKAEVTKTPCDQTTIDAGAAKKLF